MKKPLYYLDNYEKNRILEMHQTSTKKQYLTENKQQLNEWFWWVLGGAAVLSLGTSFYMNWKKGNGKEAFTQMTKACQATEAGKAKLLNSASEHKTISKNLNDAFEIVDINPLKYFSGSGPEGTTDEEKVKSNLAKIKSIPDYCAVAKVFKQSYGTELGEELKSEIGSAVGDLAFGNEFIKYVMEPLQGAVNQTQKDEENAQPKKNEDVKTDDQPKKDEDEFQSNDKEDKGGAGGQESDSEDVGIKWTTCMSEFKFGCKDLEYTNEVKKIQRCLGLDPSGKFGKKTESELQSQFGKKTINDDEIPLLCGDF
jgi:hypothetical protein